MEAKLQDNISRFVKSCTNQIGEFTKEMFECDTLSEYEDLKIDSPIEQILYCAIKTLVAVNLIERAEIIAYVWGVSVEVISRDNEVYSNG